MPCSRSFAHLRVWTPHGCHNWKLAHTLLSHGYRSSSKFLTPKSASTMENPSKLQSWDKKLIQRIVLVFSFLKQRPNIDKLTRSRLIKCKLKLYNTLHSFELATIKEYLSTYHSDHSHSTSYLSSQRGNVSCLMDCERGTWEVIHTLFCFGRWLFSL